MKEIKINLLNTYTCQVCSNEFKVKEDYIITIGVFPLCSNRCFFRLNYNLISRYTNTQLYSLHIALNFPNYCKYPKNVQIYEYSKKYVNKLLSSDKGRLLNTQNVV